MKQLLGVVALALSFPLAAAPDQGQIDEKVRQAMAATSAQGLAIAVIEDGKVVRTAAYGLRNGRGEKLQTDTIMYGASLTKAAVGYMVLQLVDEDVIALDTPVAKYLAKPVPEYATEDKYAPWVDLAGDERWRLLTPRILLTHSSGFANFAFLEPDEKLRIHFQPGSRYAYSGEGLILLQFMLERGIGLDVGAEMQRRVFDRFEMRNTSMTWRADFAKNLADGWQSDGSIEPHDERSKVRAAGSMDTTIEDMARFAAGIVRGEGLSASSAAQYSRGSLPITTRSQFPTLQPEVPEAERVPGLAAAIGVLRFDGPQGQGFMKGGHNDSTGNVMVCVHTGRRCVVILANDVRAEAAFPELVRFLIGETGAPWEWEYGEMVFWQPAAASSR